MIIRSGGKKRTYKLDEPLRHEGHKKPVTRRDFLAQGFVAGSATVAGPSLLGLLTMPQFAHAALSPSMLALKTACGISDGNANRIPFICFDCAGGANFAGSEVLVGQSTQTDFLSTAGYSKLGIGTMVPNASATGNFIDRTLGLAFHSDSAILRGITSKITVLTTAPRVNGCVIPARSENDTSNNMHNPLYGIAKVGALGGLTALIGSQNSPSGGNSVAPTYMIDPEKQPTKVDSIRDARGLVTTGDFTTLFPGPTGLADTNAVMESVAKVSGAKMNNVSTLLDPQSDTAARDLARCNYVKTAYLADRYSAGANTVDPSMDPYINGTAPGVTGPIFSTTELNDNEFQKTAAIMKLVIDGFAGAGCITMGGYDYHTGDRSTGEQRNERLGKCIGACLEYAARLGKAVMIYVFSDGSVFSNGTVDNSMNGRGKGVWTGDNQAGACSFFLVYNPIGRPVLASAAHQQLGAFSAGGDVMAASSPAGNSVTNLVEMAILNYLALHGDQGQMATYFPNTIFNNATMIDRYAAFAPLSTSTPPPPPPPPGTYTSCGATGNAAISGNHGHELVVPPADLDLTAPKTYNIQGSSGHPHTVTLSVANFQALKLGGTVSVTSTTDAGHNHQVIASCM